ncbi:MAG: hypothetical protein E4H38_00840 [Gemmatimonadales bacterium]|nr:MAG: hypothetical protein E4H38_00840 [Gemmatimonadales bacterium]
MTRTWSRLRRAVAARGFTPATWIPAASEGRAEEATIREARVVEDLPVSGRRVGAAESWPGTVAFLDGTQQYEVMAYAGASPLVVAEVAAAVMERRERQLRVARAKRRRLVLARPSVLADLGDTLTDHEAIELPETGPSHPVRDFQLARLAIDSARGRLEVEVGSGYRRESSAWMIVDGSLTESPHWSNDPRMIGVAKSHATMPFSGEALEQYLRLPQGWRSPVFEPAGRKVAPVYSWALRLWPWEGKNLLHGLIRVETAASGATLENADRLSRWLLAERAPVSAPDPRWDRLLYGIHAVEQYLKASALP